MTANAGIVVVGCINSDIVAFVSRLPRAGETVFSSSVETHFGGKGANQAAQAALLLQYNESTAVRMGHECFFGKAESAHIQDFENVFIPGANRDADVSTLGAEAQKRPCICGVALIGRVGKDTAGASFMRHFASLGIDTRGVAIDPQNGTGTALVTVAEDGENTIAYMPASNAFINKNHLLLEPSLSLIRNAKVVVSENGIPGPVSVECFRIAKAANAVTVFTPAPIDFVDPEICCFTDFLLCNSVEAQALLKVWGEEAVPGHNENEMDIARRLHDGILQTAGRFPHGTRGLGNVVITRGSKPCIVFANGKFSQVPLAQKIPSELVVDTTGAGDSFAGAFAYFLLLTPDAPEVVVSRAAFVASQSVLKKGAAESYAGRVWLLKRPLVPDISTAGQNAYSTDAITETPYVAIRLGTLRNVWRCSPFNTKLSAIDSFWGREIRAPPLADTKQANPSGNLYSRPTSPWVNQQLKEDRLHAREVPIELAASRMFLHGVADLTPNITGDGRLG